MFLVRVLLTALVLSAPLLAQQAPCFNPSDPADIRLWPGTAPGSTGDDPCRDIPFLRVFPAAAPSTDGRAFIIIPGGGYDRLTGAKEQTPVAEYFRDTLHLTSFVLIYRLVQPDGTYRYPVPMWDAQRALRLVRSRARSLRLDPDRIGLFGFSAGGHLAATLALHSAASFGLPSTSDPANAAIDQVSARVDLLGLGYPVLSMDPAAVPPSGSYRNLLRGFSGAELAHLQQYLSAEKNVTPRTPPVFLFESMDDTRISPQNSVVFAQALRSAGIPVEEHLFRHGEHGSGLATGIPEEEAWPRLFQTWLASH